MLVYKNRRTQYLSTLSAIGLLSLANMVGSTVSFADQGQNARDGSAGTPIMVADASNPITPINAKANCKSSGGTGTTATSGTGTTATSGTGTTATSGTGTTATSGTGTTSTSSTGTGTTSTSKSGTGTAAVKKAAVSGTGLKVKAHAASGGGCASAAGATGASSAGAATSASGTGQAAVLTRATTEPLSVSVFNTGVGAATDAHGNVQIFTRNGQLFNNSQAAGTTQAQGFFPNAVAKQLTNIQGGVYTMLSDPVVATAQNGMLDVMWVNGDGNVWHVFQQSFDAQGNPVFSAPTPITNNQVSQKQLSIPQNSSTIATTAIPFLGSDLINPTKVAAVSGTSTATPVKTAHAIKAKAHAASGGGSCSGNVTVNVATACINATGGVALTSASGSGACTTDAGSVPASNVAVGTVNGKIQAFWVGHDGTIYGISQKNANDETDWTQPNSFGSNGLVAEGHPNVITDGKRMLVVIASNDTNPKTGNVGSIFTLDPLAANCPNPARVTVSGNGSVQPIPTSNVTGFFNADGRVELVFRGTDESIWHLPAQSADIDNPKFASAQQLGESGIVVTSDPAVVVNTDGKPQIFARDTNDDIITTERVSADNGINGVWDAHVDLVNNAINHVDGVASPITVAINNAKEAGGVQLFYVGGKNRSHGGVVNQAAVNTSGGVTTQGTANPAATQQTTAINAATSDKIGPSSVWTLVQTSAGSNPDVMKPDAQGNIATNWTVPHEIVGTTMADNVPTTITLCKGNQATQSTAAASSVAPTGTISVAQ